MSVTGIAKTIAGILARVFQYREGKSAVRIVADNALDGLAAFPLVDQLIDSSQRRRTYWAADLEGNTNGVRSDAVRELSQAARTLYIAVDNLYGEYKQHYEESREVAYDCGTEEKPKTCYKTEYYWDVPWGSPDPRKITGWRRDAKRIADRLGQVIASPKIEEESYEHIELTQRPVGTGLETALSTTTYGFMYGLLVLWEDIDAQRRGRGRTHEEKLRNRNSQKMLDRRDFLRRLSVLGVGLVADEYAISKAGVFDERKAQLREEIDDIVIANKNLPPNAAFQRYLGWSVQEARRTMPPYAELRRGIDVAEHREVERAFQAVERANQQFHAAWDRHTTGGLGTEAGIALRRAYITEQVVRATEQNRWRRIRDLLGEAAVVGASVGAVFGTGEYFIQKMDRDDDTGPHLFGF